MEKVWGGAETSQGRKEMCKDIHIPESMKDMHQVLLKDKFPDERYVSMLREF